MRPLHCLSIAAVLFAGAPAVTQQQAQNPRVAAMKAALRNLVVAQENYFANHGTYTTDVSALGFFDRTKFRTDSIWVQVIHAGGRSWSGRAVHRALRAKSCAIYIGYLSDFPSLPFTDADSVRVTREGDPTCDAM